jgi:mycothiol synthase
MQQKYIIRNYYPQDYQAYIRINMSFSKTSTLGRTDSLEVLTQILEKPDYRPGNDLFIAEAGGNIIGYVSVIPEHKIGRVILDYLVHPDFFNGTLPRELINRAIERAKIAGVNVAHMNISTAELATEKMLLSLGFSLVLSSHELRLDLRKTNIDTDVEFQLDYHRLKRGEEEKLVEIQNRCFKDTWGYNPCNIEHIRWWLNFRRNNLEDVILAFKENELIGYCWTGTNCGSDNKGEIRGRIYMMGIDPEYRGYGFGKELILKGITYVKNKGRDIIDLTVNSDNDTAMALYSALGFKPTESTLWYEKTIE